MTWVSSAEKLFELALHKLPYLLFVSLPFFALILKLLYITKKGILLHRSWYLFSASLHPELYSSSFYHLME